jgi:hypothetical protein
MASFQYDAPITPLRQRMQEDMLMRGLGSHTRQDYIRHVRRFATFLGRAPDTATVEDIRRLCAYDAVDPAEICCQSGCGLHERQERHPPCTG